MRKVSEVKRLINDSDWTFDQSNPSLISSIHPYPAKFIEEIPTQLLDIFDLDPHLTVMDPFMGSGTTLVSARRKGYDVLGIDLNPIAYLITSVKLHELPHDFMQIADEVAKSAMNKYISDNVSMIEIPNGSHWFLPEVQKMLSAVINEIQTTYVQGTIRNALELSVSSIIVKVSYQESDTRYAAKKNFENKDSVLKAFLQAAKKIFLAIKNESSNLINNESDINLILGSSLEVDVSRYSGKVGAIITSPPYPNAYEYWLYHKFRMEFLGYSSKEIKKEEIGTRSKYFRKVPESIDVFRKQMELILSKANSILVNHGFVAIIVGRSIIHGEYFDNATDMIKLGENSGLEFVTKVERNIKLTRKAFNTKNSRINEESIVIFRKAKG